MTHLREENKRQISQKKLEILTGSVHGLEDKITAITGLNEKMYEVKEVAWKQTLNQIKATLEEDNYFLFIGRFSAGKSSFINKFIGIDILPTANVPCTAVVTEVRFTDGGQSDGKVVYQDGQVYTVLQDDLRDMIIGKKKVDNGAIHHLELYLDINKLGDSKDSLKSLVDKVVIVDCPGFDSPYKFSDEILYEYVDKASFTFYMMPADDFGGFKEVSRLGALKKKTATLIPIISKSDRIEDEESREEIVEQFKACMACKFETDDPIFVSSYRYEDFLKCSHEHMEDIMMGTVTPAQQDEINRLWMESGMPYIYNQIASKAKESELNDKKVASVLYDFNVIVNELRKASVNEENHWRRELDKLGYSMESKSYRLLDANSKAIESYIDDQARIVGNELKNAIIVELAAISPKENDKQRKVEEIFAKAFGNIQEKYNPIWERRFKDYFDGQKAAIAAEDANFAIPNINDFPAPLSYIPMGILDGIKRAGFQSISIAAIGGTMIASKAAIAGIAVVGGPLSALAGLVGVAALGYAGISSVPSISDALDERKARNEKLTERALSDLMDNDSKLNFEAAIRDCLTRYRDAFTCEFKKARGAQQTAMYDNYQKSVRIKEDLERIQTSLNLQVGE